MAHITPAAELPTIWEVPDDLWQQFILPLLTRHDPVPATGRPRIDQRRAFNGVLFILRSGCQWNRLPERFGSDSSVHRTFQRWVSKGVFQKLWSALTAYARRLGLVDFKWQSADCSMGKARCGGATSAAKIPRTAANRARNAAS